MRTVSSEDAQSNIAAPNQHCSQQPKSKNNLVHAVSNETLPPPSQHFLQQASKAIHKSTETLNLLKRPHLGRVTSTKESHVFTVSSGKTSIIANSATSAFNCNASNLDHIPPHINDISKNVSSNISCMLSQNSNVTSEMDEESNPITMLTCSQKCEVPSKISPNATDNSPPFFNQIFNRDIIPTSNLTYSALPCQLPPSLMHVPKTPVQVQGSYTPMEKQGDSNIEIVCSNSTAQSLMLSIKNGNYNSHFSGEMSLGNDLEGMITSVPFKPSTIADIQRPNLLSLHNACCTDQQEINTFDILSNKWRSDLETLPSVNSEVVNFKHIGHKVVLSGAKVGILKYFGGVEFETGNWCGIELDEPEGLNDGSVKGKRYFNCKSGYGILAPQSKVQLYMPIKSKSQFCDILPLLGEREPTLLSCTNEVSNIEVAEEILPDSSTIHNTRTNQVWETSAGSPKAAQQINISKQNSFELDESLGILTPDQLPDQLVSLSISVDSFLTNQTYPESLPPLIKDALEADAFCESDGSEDLLSRAALSNKSDPKNADVSDRTLSPEDLPMDPPGQSGVPLGSEDVKEVRSPGPSSRSHPPSNSIITSITSIGSLDTDGYQGDGELSRPASRNNCASPTGVLTHKVCVLKMKTSAQDPMTDSDFFTESDADDLAGPGRGGDRHAQVIDGTLYNNASSGGCLNQQHQRCPSFTASINEEMESSGVYSDLERKSEETPVETNSDEKAVNIVFSPDISTNTESTKSEPSQVKDVSGFTTTTAPSNTTMNRSDEPFDVTLTEATVIEQETENMEVVPDNDQKDFEGSQSVISNASSQGLIDTKPSKKGGVELKKYKMPKRNVVSKIKAMIEASPTNRVSTEEDTLVTATKPVRKGRWDAVMSKIAQGQADEKMKPARLKEVKSKVFACPTVASTKRKLPGQSTSTKKDNQTPLKTKSRRGRTRASSSSSLPSGPQTQADSGAGISPTSSQRSSLSDLANTPRSNKKVLAPRSTSPSPATPAREPAQLQHTSKPIQLQLCPVRGPVEMKTPPARKPTARRTEKHKILRDHNRLAACKAEQPPAPTASTELRHSVKCVQTLAIMVQYLVHEVDAFSVPHLKERLNQMTEAWRTVAQERDELLARNSRLQDDLNQASLNCQEQLEELQFHQQEEFKQVIKRYEDQLAEQASAHTKQLESVSAEHRAACEQLQQQLDTHTENLQQEHEAALKIVRAEHDERLARLQAKCDTLDSDNTKIKNQYCAVLESMKMDKDSRLQATAEECRKLQEDVNSLKAVLHIRQEELQDIRVKNARNEHIKEELQAEMNRNSALQLRIEDLEVQLELKVEEERRLSLANVRLTESFQHESFNAKRLSQHNEELKWKLKTQSEIYNQLVAGDTSIDRSIKSLLGNNSKLPTDFCSDNESDKGLCCSDGEPLPHKMSYLERSDSIAWTYDMVDPTKKVNKGGTVRRIKSFHDANSSGFRDMVTSPRHVKSTSNSDKRRSAIETGAFYPNWPLASSTPIKNDVHKQLNLPSDPSPIHNSIEIDHNEQLINLETMVEDKGGCTNLQLQSTPVPKESAGEAMISEETSEEEDSSEQHSTDEESSSEVMLS